MNSNALSATGNPATATSASVVKAHAQGPRSEKSKFVCYNCGKEGHGTKTCPLPRDEKAIDARRNANRTVAARAEKRSDEALVAKLRARVEQLEQIELARRGGAVAQIVVEQAAPAAPAVVQVEAVNQVQNAPAEVLASVKPADPILDPAPIVPLGSVIETYLTDARVMDKWETFWWVCDWCMRLVCGLGFLSALTSIIFFVLDFGLAVASGGLIWSVVLALCWWFRPGPSDFTTYQLIGSAYPKASEFDRRHVTFMTCPINSPNYEPDANYMTYWLIQMRGGKYSRKQVTISHTLWREAGAPKNESRYTTSESLKTAYADTVSFLRTHGHVNLNRDIQAARHVLNHTAAFYVFKLKVDLFLDEGHLNVSSQ